MGAECLTICFPGFVQWCSHRIKPLESFSTLSQPGNSWEPGLTTWEEQAYRASYRSIPPHPLLYTQLLWLRCVLFYLLSSPQPTANSADIDPFVVSRIQSGSLFPEPHGCSFLAGYLDILNSKCIIVSTLKSPLITFLSMVALRPPPPSHFSPCLSSMLALVPMLTGKKKARTVVSLGMAQSSFKLKTITSSSLESLMRALTFLYLYYVSTHSL